MGNCCCLERARVAAWDDDDWGLPAEYSAGSSRERRVASAENDDDGGGMRFKIRMTKGQLRRLMESAGQRGASDEDVMAEIMSMGTVHLDVAEFRRGRPPTLETIQEDDGLDE